MIRTLKIIILSAIAVISFLFASCTNPTIGAFLAIDSAQCIGCAECTDVCATKAIRLVNNKAILDPASCVECGKCVTVCPKDAIY